MPKEAPPTAKAIVMTVSKTASFPLYFPTNLFSPAVTAPVLPKIPNAPPVTKINHPISDAETIPLYIDCISSIKVVAWPSIA